MKTLLVNPEYSLYAVGGQHPAPCRPLNLPCRCQFCRPAMLRSRNGPRTALCRRFPLVLSTDKLAMLEYTLSRLANPLFRGQTTTGLM